MSISNYLENKFLDKALTNTDFTAAATYVALHTGDPGETGTNEVSGGSYARQAATWNAASSGISTNDGALSFADMPACTVVAASVWDASSAGNMLFAGFLGTGSPKGVFTAEADDDIFTSKGHGLSDTHAVVLYVEGLGATIPTGVTAGTVYYVRDATTDTFKLAATSGGSAINITVDGNGGFIKVTPKVVNAADTFQIADTDYAIALF